MSLYEKLILLLSALYCYSIVLTQNLPFYTHSFGSLSATLSPLCISRMEECTPDGECVHVYAGRCNACHTVLICLSLALPVPPLSGFS
jgi:hypothetical protein